MKKFRISAPKTYEVKGEEKTSWHEVGFINITNDGKIFVTLNQNPTQTYVAFEIKDEKKEKKQEVVPTVDVNDDKELNKLFEN